MFYILLFKTSEIIGCSYKTTFPSYHLMPNRQCDIKGTRKVKLPCPCIPFSDGCCQELKMQTSGRDFFIPVGNRET